MLFPALGQWETEHTALSLSLSLEEEEEEEDGEFGVRFMTKGQKSSSTQFACCAIEKKIYNNNSGYSTVVLKPGRRSNIPLLAVTRDPNLPFPVISNKFLASRLPFYRYLTEFK